MAKTLKTGRAKHWPHGVKLQLPDAATTLETLSTYPLFVVARDTFMSGWGEARNGSSFYVLACRSSAEAATVTANANAREDMEGPRMISALTASAIGARAGDHVSITTPHDSPRWYRPGGFGAEA